MAQWLARRTVDRKVKIMEVLSIPSRLVFKLSFCFLGKEALLHSGINGYWRHTSGATPAMD